MINSFIPAISIPSLQVLYYSEAIPTTARKLYRSFTPKRPQTTAGKGLAQGPYVMARAGVEPTTLRLKVIDSTKAPSRPMITDIVRTDDSKLLQEWNLTTRQPCRAPHHVIHLI